MSPEFVRLEKVLHYISSTHDYAIDIQWIENRRNSDANTTEMVLYIFYGNDEWEYHYFKLPNREVPLANIKVDEFCFFMA